MSTCFARNEDYNPPAEEERTNERDIGLDQNPLHSLPHLINSLTLIDSLLMQRRMSFCGWINDNEPNDICTKQLILATMMQLKKVICETDTHNKSRWDEKPEWRPFWLFNILFMFSFFRRRWLYYVFCSFFRWMLVWFLWRQVKKNWGKKINVFLFYFIPIVLKKYLGKFNFLLFGHFHGRSNKDNNFLRTRIM